MTTRKEATEKVCYLPGRGSAATDLWSVSGFVTLENRIRLNDHRPAILWLTGLSGAGKSTLGVYLERALFRLGYYVVMLDGDSMRLGLNSDLGFSPQDRSENIRRIGEVAGLFAKSGAVVIAASISPYRRDRDLIRSRHPDLFNEIYVEASLDVCEQRDPKGLYRKARMGQIPQFTGIAAPYESPLHPELVLDTGKKSIEENVDELVQFVTSRCCLA